MSTNIVIRTIESGTGTSETNKDKQSEDDQQSLYDQIKRKYMKEATSN